MKQFLNYPIFAVFLAAPFVATAATTIYQHDFSGGAVELGGTTTDIGDGIWQNGNGDDSSSFQANGSVVAGSDG